MASELLRKQWKMTMLLPRLIDFIYENGWACTLGDAFRDARCPYGKKYSNHKIRLATDLNVFVGDRWLDMNSPTEEDLEIYRRIGNFWKGLDPDCRWGGDFEEENAGDYNHFSLEHQGRS